MTLRDGQRAEILFLLTLIGKCTLEIPGDLADAYSTLLAETGTRASVVCGPWLFEAIGTPPWTPAVVASLQAGLALLFSEWYPCWCFSKMRPGFECLKWSLKSTGYQTLHVWHSRGDLAAFDTSVPSVLRLSASPSGSPRPVFPGSCAFPLCSRSPFCSSPAAVAVAIRETAFFSKVTSWSALSH